MHGDMQQGRVKRGQGEDREGSFALKNESTIRRLQPDYILSSETDVQDVAVLCKTICRSDHHTVVYYEGLGLGLHNQNVHVVLYLCLTCIFKIHLFKITSSE